MAEAQAYASDLVTCPACLQIFVSPRSLDCGHSFCLSCIRTQCDGKPASTLSCPLCRQKVKLPGSGVEGLPRNDHLERLAEARISSCQMSKDENVESEKTLSQRLRGHYCEKHADQLTTARCLDCRQNICATCTDSGHKKHKSKSIEALAFDLKPQIETSIKTASSRLAHIREEEERLSKEKDTLIDELGRQEAAILRKGEELKSIIDLKVQKLLEELESIKAESLSTARAADDVLRRAADMVESFCEYSRWTQTTGRSHDVVRYASAIRTQAEELRADGELVRTGFTAPCVVFSAADSDRIDTRQLLGYISVPISSSVGQTLTTLPDGEPLYNVTSLDENIFVLRWKESEQIEVFDAESYGLIRRLTVPDLEGFADMTSSGHSRCLYVSDYINDCLHHVLLDGTVTQWPVTDGPCGISVSAATHNVLVTCHDVCTIKELSPTGQQLRTIPFGQDIANPWHTIQLGSGHFVVCHGGLEDSVHRVCRLDDDGHVVHSIGGPPGSQTPVQLNVPWHLAVDEDEFIFVADHDNRRVVLLSPQLDYLRQVVARDRLRWDPHRVCVDAVRRRLYVVENEWKNAEFAAGRVVVYHI